MGTDTVVRHLQKESEREEGSRMYFETASINWKNPSSIDLDLDLDWDWRIGGWMVVVLPSEEELKRDVAVNWDCVGIAAWFPA